MRDFSIDLIWTKLQMACAALGGWIGYFVGGMDGMLIALIVFMVLDVAGHPKSLGNVSFASFGGSGHKSPAALGVHAQYRG